MTNLSETLRDARLDARLTQVNLAKLVGVSRTAVANWESGAAKPSQENLIKLASVLNAPVLLRIENNNGSDGISDTDENSSLIPLTKMKYGGDPTVEEIMEVISEKLSESKIDKILSSFYPEQELKKYNVGAKKKILVEDFVKLSEGIPDVGSYIKSRKSKGEYSKIERPIVGVPISLEQIFPAAKMLGGADIPLYASAQGGPEGELVDTSSPVDFVRRPEILEKIRTAFAVYVVGESMSPAYEQGDMVLVNPSKAAFSGQDVILMSNSDDGACRALIKRLISRSDKRLKVREFFPERREFELDPTDWPHIFPIVGKYNRR